MYVHTYVGGKSQGACYNRANNFCFDFTGSDILRV